MKILNAKSIIFYFLSFILMLIQTQCIIDDDVSVRDETETTDNAEENEDEQLELEEVDLPEEENEDEQPEEEVNLTDAQIVLTLVNAARAENGLSALVLNDALNTTAFLHSEDMLNNDYFAHEGLNGSKFWERTEDAGYTGTSRGENIAKGQRTAEAVHEAWMESDGHRANILNSAITEMGLARSTSGNYWTQIFGTGN